MITHYTSRQQCKPCQQCQQCKQFNCKQCIARCYLHLYIFPTDQIVFRQRNAALRGKTKIHNIIIQSFTIPETDIGRKIANNICIPGSYQRVRQRGVGGVNWRWSIQFHSRRVLCYIIPIASMAVLFNIPKVGPLHDQSSITLLSEGNVMKWRYFFLVGNPL